MPYIQRKIEPTILSYLEKPEILAILGPRQCGKTTLLQHIFENLRDAIFLTFEDQKILALFDDNIDEFIALYVKPYHYLFIDEFQYARNGGKSLKYIFDTQKIKIIISGSSSIDLTLKTMKFLVGRIFSFELFPLDFEEFLSYRGVLYLDLLRKNRFSFEDNESRKVIITETTLNAIRKFYEEYLLYGGYPRVVLSESREEKEFVLKNIFNTYFLRDVRDILGLVDDHKLQILIKALALQIGNLFNFQELARISEWGYQSVKRYMHFLEETYILSEVRPFFRNRRTEIVKNPKVYFFDTGLRNYIVEDFRKITDRPDGGALLENGFFMELRKHDFIPRFWRSKQKEEVDFILEQNGKIIALEIKKHITHSLPRSLKVFIKKDLSHAKGFVLYYEGDIHETSFDEVKQFPIFLFGPIQRNGRG